jgi:superfamily II DNA or RNA helicase
MFRKIPTQDLQKLWRHQADALTFAVRHLNTFDTPCLIRMPTGTGKTGVVACLTMLSNQAGTSLVLTPWAHLRDQMVEDLNGAFWKKVRISPVSLKAVPATPSSVLKVMQTDKPKVIVATFTALNQIRTEHTDAYDRLREGISLVIVDEGHYEPAVEWKKSVTGLGHRTVLLTATPYRNDLKLFRIADPDRSTHHFTHKEATENRIIRELRFEELGDDTRLSALSASFADRWRQLKRRKDLPSPEPRAIVCCSSGGDIETTVAELRKKGIDAIGIHERFANSRSRYLLEKVPEPGSTDAEIWVHQHKLTEGLDDHRFCCVALFTRINNDRKLIQQIGRVLRRDRSDARRPALLLAPKEWAVESEWSAYLEFETDLKLLEPKHFRDVVNGLLSSQPKVEYFEGKFRRRFDPDSLPKNPQVLIAPSVLVRTLRSGFSLAEYIEDCTDTLNTQDAVILGPEMNAPCQQSGEFALWVYASEPLRLSRRLHTLRGWSHGNNIEAIFSRS